MLGPLSSLPHCFGNDSSRLAEWHATARKFRAGKLPNGHLWEAPFLHRDGRTIWFEHRMSHHPVDAPVVGSRVPPELCLGALSPRSDSGTLCLPSSSPPGRALRRRGHRCLVGPRATVVTSMVHPPQDVRDRHQPRHH